MPLDDAQFYGMNDGAGGIPAVGTYGEGSQAAAGSGVAIVTERGGTTNQQTNISTTNNVNASRTDNSTTLYDQSGNSGVIGSGNTISTANTTVTNNTDASVRTTINQMTDGGAVAGALAFGDSALHGAIDVVRAQQAQTDAEINHLITYTSDAYTQGLNAVTTNTGRTLDFFSTEVDQLLNAQMRNTNQLQNATVGAIGAAAQGVQSESAQQFTQLQGTLVKLAIAAAAVFVAFAYISRKH